MNLADPESTSSRTASRTASSTSASAAASAPLYDANAPFRERVLALVAAVPAGRVATYGQIAALAGSPLAARQVGMALRGLVGGAETRVPWQRIVNAAGGISTDKLGLGDLQRALLRREGVRFGPDGRLDLVRYRWDPGTPSSGGDAS